MDPRLAAVALSQAGVFRTAQARVVGGYSPDEIRARVLRGSWVRLRRGVLATAGTVAAARATSDGLFVLSVAAEICARSGLIVASHTAAARLHGLDFLEAVPDSVVLAIDIPGRAQAPSPGKAAVRQTSLPPEHLGKRQELPCTSPARTIIDICRELPFRDAVALADSALRRGLVNLSMLEQILRDCHNWPGIRRAMRVVYFADGRAEAVSESLARVLFAQVALPPPKLQVPIYDRTGMIGIVDFLFEMQRTIVEVDGRTKYRNDPDSLFQEKLREDRLREAGFEVTRLIWAELVGPPQAVAHKISAAFTRAARRGVPQGDSSASRGHLGAPSPSSF
jgi:hypothetical protein